MLYAKTSIFLRVEADVLTFTCKALLPSPHCPTKILYMTSSLSGLVVSLPLQQRIGICCYIFTAYTLRELGAQKVFDKYVHGILPKANP